MAGAMPLSPFAQTSTLSRQMLGRVPPGAAIFVPDVATALRLGYERFSPRSARQRFGDGMRAFFGRIDRAVLRMATAPTFASFFGMTFIPGFGSGEKSPIDIGKVEALGRRVLALINSLQTLRSLDVNIEYPDEVLMRLLGELTELHKTLADSPARTSRDENTGEGAEVQTNAEKSPGDWTQYSPRYLLRPSNGGQAALPDDAITLYNRAETPTPKDVIHAFRVGVVISKLAEREGFSPDDFEKDTIFVTLAKHAMQIANDGIDRIMEDYVALFPNAAGALQRVHLRNQDFAGKFVRLDDAKIVELLKDAHEHRPRVWEYDPSTGTRTKGSLHEVRPLGKYYGYHRERAEIGGHFTAFARGVAVPPLLLQGPTGVGKTDLPKTFFVELLLQRMENVHMIRVSPDGITMLPEIIEAFGNKPGSYVIVFDDIGVEQDADAQERQWKPFRDVFEGASRRPPKNVLLIISSNKTFPANVVTRSHLVELPNISDSRKGKATAMGIIAEFLRQAVEAKEDWLLGGADSLSAELIQTYTKFITHDFYRGQAFSELSKSVGEPEHHDFEMSPRGLIKHYLENLISSGRFGQIQRRIAIHRKKLTDAEARRRQEANSVTKFPDQARARQREEEDERKLSPEERDLRVLARQMGLVDAEGKDAGLKTGDTAPLDAEAELRKFGVRMPGEPQGLRVVPPPAETDGADDGEVEVPVSLDDDDPSDKR